MTGSGTEEDPYIIEDVDDLQDMSNDLDAYYELGNDIDASATSGWNGGAGFLPVGEVLDPFIGELDGKGYAINWLYINRPTTDYVALFPALNDSFNQAIINNLHFNVPNITGQDVVGVLVAAGAFGTMTDCGVIGGGVHGRDKVGGFKSSGGYCTRCSSVGVSVYVENGNGGRHTAGGFAAHLIQSNNNCYARNKLVAGGYYTEIGGFAVSMSASGGMNYGYSASTYAGATPYRAYGFCKKFLTRPRYSYWNGSIWPEIGSDQGGIEKTTAEMKIEGTYEGLNFETIWDINESINAGYPFFLDRPPSGLPSGYIWVEGTKLHYTDENFYGRFVEGADLGGTHGQGYYWVEGVYLHYIDASGDERRITGIASGATGATPGHIWIEGTYLHYIDANGDERYAPL